MAITLQTPPLRLVLPAGSQMEPGGPARPGLLFTAKLPWPGHVLAVEASPRAQDESSLNPDWAKAEQERLAALLPGAQKWSTQAATLAGRPALSLAWSTPEQTCQRLYLPAQGWLYQITLAQPAGTPARDLAAMVEPWQLAQAPPSGGQAPSEAAPVAAPAAVPATAAKPLTNRQALYSLDPPSLARLQKESEARAEQNPRDAQAAAAMVEAKVWQALALAKQGLPVPDADWSRLRAKAVKVYRRHPEAASALRALGMAMIMEERLAKASKYLQAALQADATDGANLLALAMVPGQEAASRADLGRRAVKASPELPASHLMLAWALEEQGLSPEAAPLYQAALALQPDNQPALLGLARLEMDVAASRRAAEERLRRVLALTPGHQAARFNLALVLLTQDKPEDAQRLAQGILLQNPQDASAHNLRGLALLARKQYAEASQAFEAASQADPRHAQALYNLGGVCAGQLQNTACARQAFQRFLELEPQGPRADKARAWLQRHGG